MTPRPDPPEERPAGAARRWALFAAGWLCFALGLLGTVLPILPTTPFMLLALWAFSASSARFHGWLWDHRVFGPPLRRWKRDRVVPLWSKAVAIGSMVTSLLYAALVHEAPWWALAAIGAVMLYGAWFVTRFPSRPPAADPAAPRTPSRPG